MITHIFIHMQKEQMDKNVGNMLLPLKKSIKKRPKKLYYTNLYYINVIYNIIYIWEGPGSLIAWFVFIFEMLRHWMRKTSLCRDLEIF